jgi:5-methylcytosine-specific restriction enzyme A
VNIRGRTIQSWRFTTLAYGISAARGRCHPRTATPRCTGSPATSLRAAYQHVYNLVRYSGEARLAAVATIADTYLQDDDDDTILADAGLADADIADDEVPADDVVVARSPLEEEYRRLCGIGAGPGDSGTRFGKPRISADILRLESARRAVLLRSEGHCENPSCTGEPQDITDAGRPILDVDHIKDLALGGRDHPEQMIALCPNCHATKTRGRTREQLRDELFKVARQRHTEILSR